MGKINVRKISRSKKNSLRENLGIRGRGGGADVYQPDSEVFFFIFDIFS